MNTAKLHNDGVFHLLHLTYGATSEEAERVLRNTRARPGTVEELLDMDKRYPEMKSRFPIVAIGREPNGRLRVGFVHSGCSKENLSQIFRNGVWSANCRFL